MSKIDVLSIGDVVTDAFIKMLPDTAHTYSNEDGKFLAIPFGAKLPFDHDEVMEGDGNAANASVSFSRLGLNAGLVSNVGQDKRGKDIIAALRDEGIDTQYIRVNPGKQSNYNYILWYKEERTILVQHEQYEYYWPNIHKADIPAWVYFSSLSKNSLPYHDDLADWLEEHKEVKLAFQPGTFQMAEGAKRLKRLYKRCEILVLNRQEAALVGGGDEDDMHDLFDKLHELGPKTICITDGPKGSYASSPGGRLFMPTYPDPKPPVERTGAGDAFASTFVAALAKGLHLEDALKWGPVNSMNVVQHVGPHKGLLSETELRKHLKEAPSWYRAKPLKK